MHFYGFFRGIGRKKNILRERITDNFQILHSPMFAFWSVMGICVASAKKDSLKSIKQLIESAAKRQGMTKDTKVTVIADGAKNCWQATNSLSKEIGHIEYIRLLSKPAIH